MSQFLPEFKQENKLPSLLRYDMVCEALSMRTQELVQLPPTSQREPVVHEDRVCHDMKAVTEQYL